MTKKTTNEEIFNAWIAELRAMRGAIDADERRMVLRLREFEMAREVWEHAKPTFGELLAAFELMKPERYVMLLNALDTVGIKTAEVIGMHGSVQAAAIVDAKKRSTAIEEMRLVAAEHKVPLSKQNAQRIKNRYEPPQSKAVTEARRIAELEATVRRLTRENRDLQREVAALKKQLRQLA